MKNRSYWFMIITIILLVLLIGVGFLTIPRQIERTIIVIGKGDSASKIAQNLVDNNLIYSTFIFKLYTKISGCDKKMKPGRYIFEEESNLFITVNKICNGDYELMRFTVPEGLSLERTLNQIAGSLNFTRSSLDSLANNSEFCEEVTGFDIGSLEGFLYPETYHVEDDSNPEQVLKIMVKQGQRLFKQAGVGSLEQLSYYETLVLASIVEKEAKNREEMPIIADVYRKRLKLRMKLGASPTVQYLLEKQGKHREFLYYKDTEIESPYNTYLNYGLPPTPICSPSIYAVNAVLEPANTEYLYFFADGAGGHIFTKSYQEHLDQRRSMRRKK